MFKTIMPFNFNNIGWRPSLIILKHGNYSKSFFVKKESICQNTYEWYEPALKRRSFQAGLGLRNIRPPLGPTDAFFAGTLNHYKMVICQFNYATRNKKLLGAPGIATRSKKLLVAPGLPTSNKKLLGAPGIATRSKDTTRGSWSYY